MKETLEEASENRGLRWHKEGTVGFMHSKGDFVASAKCQAEKMYSDEEVLDLLYRRDLYLLNRDKEVELELPNEWFEEFKKK